MAGKGTKLIANNKKAYHDYFICLSWTTMVTRPIFPTIGRPIWMFLLMIDVKMSAVRSA